MSLSQSMKSPMSVNEVEAISAGSFVLCISASRGSRRAPMARKRIYNVNRAACPSHIRALQFSEETQQNTLSLLPMTILPCMLGIVPPRNQAAVANNTERK